MPLRPFLTVSPNPRRSPHDLLSRLPACTSCRSIANLLSWSDTSLEAVHNSEAKKEITMRKNAKRLSLNTETLRVLADGNLNAFRGGIIYSQPYTECCTQSLTTSHDACCYPTTSSNDFTNCC
jgi:hypothetical protein